LAYHIKNLLLVYKVINLNIYIFCILFFITNKTYAKSLKNDINISYKAIFHCIEKGNCANLNKNYEILSSLIIAFDKTKNEKYIKHIINNADFKASYAQKTILLYIINLLERNQKTLSSSTIEEILNNINISEFSYKDLYRMLNLLKTDNQITSPNIANIVQNIWIYNKFSSSDSEALFFLKYQKYFNLEIFNHRINQLLISGNIQEAIRINNLFKEGTDARELNDKKIHITQSCKTLSKNMLEKWYEISTNDDGINAILLKCMVNANASQKTIKFASRIKDKDGLLGDMIWKYQNLATIEALNNRDYNVAIDVLKSSIPRKKSDYVHHQFLLGWIYLTFLDKPSLAIDYFENIIKNSGYAISIARGNYWLGRCCDAMNQNEKAIGYYEKASEYPTTFYGQKAIKKLNFSLKNKIDGYMVNINISENIDNAMFKTGLLLNKYNLQELSLLIIQDSMIKKSKDEVLSILYNSSKILNKYELAPIVRYATRFGVFLPKISYPKIHDKMDNFTSSIIRQESGFTIDAISEKNAMGLMQVIPETAKRISKKLHLHYSDRKMLTDKEYNIRIGNEYIRQLKEIFNDNKVLVAAAYNAGPGASNKWISKFGNPSNMEDDELVNWIESITYGQTRDYVMRVMENYNMYSNIYSNDNEI